MHLIIYEWERSMFDNSYNISNDEMYILSSDFGNSVSYGLICISIYIGHNYYIDPLRVKLLLLSQFRDFYIRITEDVIAKGVCSTLLHIYWLKKTSNFTIKASFNTRIICPAISNIPEGKYEQLFVCDQYVITSGMIKLLDYETLLI